METYIYLSPGKHIFKVKHLHLRAVLLWLTGHKYDFGVNFMSKLSRSNGMLTLKA